MRRLLSILLVPVMALALVSGVSAARLVPISASCSGDSVTIDGPVGSRTVPLYAALDGPGDADFVIPLAWPFLPTTFERPAAYDDEVAYTVTIVAPRQRGNDRLRPITETIPGC